MHDQQHKPSLTASQQQQQQQQQGNASYDSSWNQYLNIACCSIGIPSINHHDHHQQNSNNNDNNNNDSDNGNNNKNKFMKYSK
jgi:hypothetical protein